MSLFRNRRFRFLLIFAAATFVLVGLPNSLVRRSHTGKEEAQTHTPNPFIGNFTARPSKKHGPVLAKHKYRADGLLEVNLDGPHPIYELIARAEKEWEEKLSRSSKTLQEAVKEYRRRYKRAPPKGFDLWYVTCFLMPTTSSQFLPRAQVEICTKAQRPAARRVRPDI